MVSTQLITEHKHLGKIQRQALFSSVPSSRSSAARHIQTVVASESGQSGAERQTHCSISSEATAEPKLFSLHYVYSFKKREPNKLYC